MAYRPKEDPTATRRQDGPRERSEVAQSDPVGQRLRSNLLPMRGHAGASVVDAYRRTRPRKETKVCSRVLRAISRAAQDRNARWNDKPRSAWTRKACQPICKKCLVNKYKLPVRRTLRIAAQDCENHQITVVLRIQLPDSKIFLLGDSHGPTRRKSRRILTLWVRLPGRTPVKTCSGTRVDNSGSV